MYSCYEAGRDGFWIHRCLTEMGGQNVVVDPASIEVNRRRRRVKTDRLDAGSLVRMLVRYIRYNEKAVWRLVVVPTQAEEDERRVNREYLRLSEERSRHSDTGRIQHGKEGQLVCLPVNGCDAFLWV